MALSDGEKRGLQAAFLVTQRKRVGSEEAAPERTQCYERVGEISLTSQRKLMSVRVVDHADGDAHVLFTKGRARCVAGALHPRPPQQGRSSA